MREPVVGSWFPLTKLPRLASDPSTLMTPIGPIVEKHVPKIRDLRRDLHANPERGYEEFETAAKVAAILEGLPGYTLRKNVAVTGIVATLDADKPGPCVAIRADMDCLPILEETGVPYASKKPGLMHACGHDGHTAALVGAALVLHEIRDELKGPVKLIFQPAEEGRFGARKMAEEGALENPRVDGVFGFHNSPVSELEFGQIALRPGALMGGGTTFSIKITGRGGHAASPHIATDPIVIGSHIVTALQTLVSRNVDPVSTLVVSVTQFHAGTTTNVIPETAELVGTIRSLSPELLESAPKRLAKLATSVAESLGGKAETTITPGLPVTYNDASGAAYCTAVASDVIGRERVLPDYPPTLGSEDFSFFLQQRPGAYFFIGTRPAEIPVLPGLHHPKFNFNDEILPLAITMHVEIARRFADNWAKFSKS